MASSRPPSARRHSPGQRPDETPAPHQRGDAGRSLATALSWNAIFSGVNGLVLTGAAAPLSRIVDVPTWLLVALGLGLVGFAAAILWVLASPARLRTGGRIIVVADLGWVVGAAVLLIATPDLLTAAGRTALTAVSSVVAVLAVAQVRGLRRSGRKVNGASPITLRVERTIPAPQEAVWSAVSDAGDYARFAAGITSTTVLEGHGEGMVRVCEDDQGGTWSETCTLWEEGRRYRMEVDIASYPPYYRALLHRFAQTWELAPTSAGTHVTLRFDGEVKLGVIGRFTAKLLGNPRRLDGILVAYERELTSPPSGD